MVQLNRSQDYLISGVGEDQPQQQNQAYRLNVPSFTGGQSFASTATQQKQQTPDRARQQFRTRERQIRENRPVDFAVETKPTTQRVKADIAGQAFNLEQELSKSAPKIEEFLPDFEKALKGDEEALQRTGQRLQTPYEQREIEPITSYAGTGLADFLSREGVDAYQTELARQRAGTYGLNALDAAILGASGMGAKAFNIARNELGKAYEDIPSITNRLTEQEAKRANDYSLAIADMTRRAQEERAKIEEQARIEQEIFKNRDISKDIEDILLRSKQASPDVAPYIGTYEMLPAGLDINPYIDRELTFEETLDEQEAQRYNAIAELLGFSPVQRATPESAINEEALMQAILADALNRKTKWETAGKKAEDYRRYRNQQEIERKNKIYADAMSPVQVLRPGSSSLGRALEEGKTQGSGGVIPTQKESQYMPKKRVKRKNMLEKMADIFK